MLNYMLNYMLKIKLRRYRTVKPETSELHPTYLHPSTLLDHFDSLHHDSRVMFGGASGQNGAGRINAQDFMLADVVRDLFYQCCEPD